MDEGQTLGGESRFGRHCGRIHGVVLGVEGTRLASGQLRSGETDRRGGERENCVDSRGGPVLAEQQGFRDEASSKRY